MVKRMWKSGTFIYPIPAVMVSSGNMEKSNIITVAWTGILNTNPAIVYISVRPERYSYNLIRESKEFVINLTTEKLTYETDWCGVRSGSKFDKFKEMGLTKEKANFVNAPLIKESPVSIECKVIDEKNFGSHTTFIAEVLCINADEKYFDEKGAFDISKCNLIAYANGGYYTLGKKIGKFGYSVEKNNSNKRNFKGRKKAEKEYLIINKKKRLKNTNTNNFKNKKTKKSKIDKNKKFNSKGNKTN